MALIGFAVGLLLSSLTAAVAEAATGYRVGSGAVVPLAVTAADVLGLWLGLVGSAVYASRMRGSGSLVEDFGYRVGAWWDLPLGAAVGLVSQYALIPLIYLPFEQFDRHLAHQLGQPAQRDTAAAHTPLTVVVVLMFLAVGAPLVEELFFRGLLLRSLAGLLPVPAAIAASSLLFALAHFEAVQLAGLAVFGAVLGVLAWATGRLGPSIGAHMAFNTAAVLASVHVR